MKHGYSLWLNAVNCTAQFRFILFFLLITGFQISQAQVFNLPTSGFDTTNSCVGLIRDPGGNNNYPSYSNGYLIIDPPGNATVNVQFTSFNTYSSFDYVQIYDGVGTSGNFLGTYWGSALPNGGSSITSTSGAITIRFYSNCCSESSGFTGSFTTNATTAPNASFVPATTSPAYNTPVQFINTSTNGGSYLWDFGDGNSSTDINPVHSYTISGPKQVKLISTNCHSSDTSNIVNITVQAAPQGVVSTDTIKLSAQCGTSNSTSFTISNTGSGNLSFNSSIQANSSLIGYQESFENGSGNFNDYYGFLTTTFPTSSAPHGNQYMRISGGGNNSMVADIPSSQPTNISYYVRSESYTSYHGEVRFAQGNFPYSTNEVLFYSVFRYSDIRLYYRDVNNGWITSHFFPQNDFQWYLIELRNIDWTARTYDVYIDNNLVLSGAGMVSTTINGVDDISFTNSNTSNSSLDGIQFNGVNPSSIFTYSPTSGSLGSGSNSVVFINANTAGLNAGVYYFDYILSSNDTALDGKIIPLQLTVTGTADLATDKNCSNFGNAFTSYTYSDSLMLTNSGCDTLNFSSVTSSGNNVTLTGTSFDLAPGDSVIYNFSFSSATVGTAADTIYFNGPDTNYVYCIQANVSGAPLISVSPPTATINHTGCNDSVNVQLVIGNSGLDTLHWGASGSGSASILENFESGSYNTANWASIGTGVQIGSSCGIINGSYGLIFNYGGSRELTTVPLDLRGGGTVSYDILFRGTCETPDNGEGIYAQYSTDNGATWTSLGYHYQNTTSAVNVSYTLPQAAQTLNTIIRIKQLYFSGVNYDSWVVDNISIQGAQTSNNITFLPDTGAVAVSAYDTVNLWINLNGLATGTHIFNAYINSNDPANPVVQVPITVNLTGLPNLVLPASCHIIDSTIVGTSTSDSVLVYNDGCGDVFFTSISAGNSILNISNSPISLLAGDSVYIQLSFNPTNGPAAFADTITFTQNNGTVSKLCIDSYIKGAPQLSIDTSAISVTINGCNDSVNVQRWLYNNGLANGNYQVIGGAGLIPLQDLLDTFKVSYTSITAHNTNQYNFSEGIFGNSIGDGGGDMYDGGNYITTSSSFGQSIPYSNDLISQNSLLGANSSYFTYKGTGVFLFAADINNVNQFRIFGNLGADGSGSTAGGVVTGQVDGVSYTGYYKKVYAAGDPSINHLIITQSNSSLNRTFLNTTGNENHTITGLQNNTRIYYILFAGQFGYSFPTSVFQNMMDDFLPLLSTNALPDWVNVNPDSGSVAVNDSVLIDIWIKSAGLTNGSHSGSITIASDDPVNPAMKIPVTVNVVGQPEGAVLQSACVSFTNIQQGAQATDSVLISNTGCDTLQITQASSSFSEYSALNLPLYIAPGDTMALMVAFLPTTVGSFIDTMSLTTNDTLLEICLNSTSVGAPYLYLQEDTIRYTLNKCKIIGNDTYRLENQGLGAMSYSLTIGGYSGFSHVNYNTIGANTQHSFTGVPAATSTDTLEVMFVLHGDYDLYYERTYLQIDNTLNYGYLPDNGLNYQNDTIILKFWGTYVQNWTSDGSLSFNLNNTNDVDGGAGSFHEVHVKLTSQVNWVSITGATSGSIAAGAVVNKNLLFNAASLAVGTYNTRLNITNNSPGAPYIQVPVILDVVAEEDIQTTDTCLSFPLTLIGDTAIAQFSIWNAGCDVLTLNSVTTTNNIFKANPSGSVTTVQIDDSVHFTVRFIPTQIGSFSASLLINNSDELLSICLDGISGAKPDAQFSFSHENLCLGEVAFTDNSTYNPTSWTWDFGDGNTSSNRNPVHFYDKPGTYSVKLFVQNSYGFDTIKQSISPSPLYVNFSSSTDTVNLFYNDSVSFYDSTLTASTWNWSFGDGNTSNVQNPVHTYTQTGVMNVKLTAIDSRGCQRQKQMVIHVINSIGTDEWMLNKSAISLYPNPSSGMVQIEITGKAISQQSKFSLQIMDVSGKLIDKFALDAEKNSIDISSLSKGFYQFRIMYNDKPVRVEKIILQ